MLLRKPEHFHKYVYSAVSMENNRVLSGLMQFKPVLFKGKL